MCSRGILSNAVSEPANKVREAIVAFTFTADRFISSEFPFHANSDLELTFLWNRPPWMSHPFDRNMMIGRLGPIMSSLLDTHIFHFGSIARSSNNYFSYV